MNLKEFISQKDTLIHYILEFEQLQRKVNLLSVSYLMEFHKELEEKNRLNFENEGLIQGIALVSKGKPQEEVKSFLEQHKANYIEYQQKFYQRYNEAICLEKQCSKYSLEDMNILDENFKSYCEFFHPLVNLYSGEEEKNLYMLLIKVYRMGNLNGFKSLLKENEKNLKKYEITEADYEMWAKEYISSIDNLKKMISNLKHSFPLTKEDIFYKEESLTREQMNLREKNYELRDMNKALHKDFLLHISFDYKL